MDQSEILSKLFDSKVLSILKFFMYNDKNEYYLREISRLTKVSPASTYRILNSLVKMELLKVREIKTAKLYCLEANKSVDFMKSIVEVDVVAQFVEAIVKLGNIEEILLLTREKNKANMLILGKDMDTNELKRVAAEMKEKHTFTVNYMTLTREQYEQMSAMGLYPGSKKLLYRKS